MQPWTKAFTRTVGGLIGIAISGDECMLFVLSWQGRGVFDLLDGNRIARDNAAPAPDSLWMDQKRKSTLGIGPLENQWLDITGLWGGKLPDRSGAWSVRLNAMQARETVELHGEAEARPHILDTPVTDVRALGFSKSGNLILLATTSDITVWKKT